jgi:hypothetical protein
MNTEEETKYYNYLNNINEWKKKNKEWLKIYNNERYYRLKNCIRECQYCHKHLKYFCLCHHLKICKLNPKNN